MTASKVFFTSLRTTPRSNLLDKMERLVRRAGIDTIDFEKRFAAIKIHFGEPGNVAYIRPNFAARMADILRSLGAKPFLTDCNTLYSGRRSNAVDHLQSAMENGFNPISARCDVIIADGLKGTDYREIPIDGEYCKAPKIGAAIADADIIISMNHFKGHEQAGFGGAIKNLGMGCASVGGKLELHCASQPVIDREHCKGCLICVKHCAHDAIHLDAERKAVIDYSKCVGCGQCIALCQYEGAMMGPGDTAERLNYKIAEYTAAVLKDKPHFHVSFIMNVSPECDCWNHNDAAIVPDLGMLASFDPVALDKACPIWSSPRRFSLPTTACTTNTSTNTSKGPTSSTCSTPTPSGRRHSNMPKRSVSAPRSTNSSLSDPCPQARAARARRGGRKAAPVRCAKRSPLHRGTPGGEDSKKP